jgi:hypothetical protein
MLEECRSVDEYEKLNRISGGWLGRPWVVAASASGVVVVGVHAPSQHFFTRTLGVDPNPPTLTQLNTTPNPTKPFAEGAYGVVFRAREKRTGRIYALKKIKLEQFNDGFPQTSVREINVLLSLHHPNIVNVSEVGAGAGLGGALAVGGGVRGWLWGLGMGGRGGFCLPIAFQIRR